MKRQLVEATLNQHQSDIRDLWEDSRKKRDRLEELDKKITALGNLCCKIDERLEQLETRMDDLAIIQNARHNNYCELREEVEKLRKGMK